MTERQSLEGMFHEPWLMTECIFPLSLGTNRVSFMYSFPSWNQRNSTLMNLQELVKLSLHCTTRNWVAELSVYLVSPTSFCVKSHKNFIVVFSLQLLLMTRYFIKRLNQGTEGKFARTSTLLLISFTLRECLDSIREIRILPAWRCSCLMMMVSAIIIVDRPTQRLLKWPFSKENRENTRQTTKMVHIRTHTNITLW